MSTEQAKPTSSDNSATPSPTEAPQPPPVPHYPPMPYNGHYPPPPAAYPPLYAYPMPDPAHHDPNAPNGAPVQPVAPFFMVPPPPPGMVYAYPMPPTAPGYPFTGIPPPQPPPKPKRKQVKMACTNCATACKRCEEKRPCERCVKYGLADSCVNSTRKERKKGIKRGPYKRKNRTNTGDAATGFTQAGEGGEQQAQVPPPPPGYPMAPEGYPFPYVYPPMGYVSAPADGQQHPEGAPPNGAPPPMHHPFYPTYPLYHHPYSAYPGAPPVPYPPLVPAPVAASPNGSAKPDAPPAVVTSNGAATTEQSKAKKRVRGKTGEDSTRSGKKSKDTHSEQIQGSGNTSIMNNPPPPFVAHTEPVSAFSGPDPRPVMGTM